jgi:hypothetical protein
MPGLPMILGNGMLFLALANSTSVWNLHHGTKKQKPLSRKRKDRKEQRPDQTFARRKLLRQVL